MAQSESFFGSLDLLSVSWYSSCNTEITGILLNESFGSWPQVGREVVVQRKVELWGGGLIVCWYSAGRNDPPPQKQRSLSLLNGINRSANTAWSGTGRIQSYFMSFSFKCNIRRWRVFAFFLFLFFCWESQPYYRSRCSFPNNPKDLERKEKSFSHLFLVWTWSCSGTMKNGC